MLLSLRGWGAEELRTASSEFMEAARFALFAEHLTPMLTNAEQIQDLSLAGADPERMRALVPAKVAAANAIPALKSLLWPEDDDG